MKISSIKINSFLGIRHLDTPLTELTLVAGLNGSGKSSLENAIRLAYTGELSRVGLKKEIGALVFEGDKQASIEIEGDPGTETPIQISAGGKATGLMSPEDAPWWAHALTNSRYLTSLDPTALRRCLFQLSGGADAGVVEKRLQAANVPPDVVEAIRPLMTKFDAAAAEAESRLKEARGEWKGITGETYGEVKAETWKAAVPELPPEPEDRTQALQAANETLRTDIANLKAAEQGRQRVETDIRAAREAQESLPGVRKQLDAASVDLERLRGSVKELEAKASGQALPQPVSKPTCPECGSIVHLMPDNTLMAEAEYAEKSKGAPDPKAKTALAAAQKELSAAQSKRARLEEEVKRVERLADRAEELAAQIKDLKAADPQALNQQLLVNINEQGQNNEALAAYSNAARARREAEAKTKKAAEAHSRAKGWALVKDLMSPDGIPAQFLDAVLTKLNERMALSAITTRWGAVQVHQDMRIMYGGRQLGLCSESEQWKVQTFLMEAVGYLTAECFMLVDRFDVLHTDSRNVFLDWCESLTKDGFQIIICGTLKQKYELPGVTVIWLEKGVRA